MYSKSKPKTPTDAQLESIKRRYVTEGGKLIVKSRDKTRMPPVGTEAGVLQSKNHLSVNVKGTRLRVHHIVWYLHHGYWPTHAIAHRDGNRTNNSIENLVMLNLDTVQA